MWRPSRDQSVASLLSSLLSRSFSSPSPLAGFSKRSYVPLRSERNTTVPPSGDQTGTSLLAPPNVKRELTPRVRSRIQMSAFPPRGSFRPKARRSPARDSAGFPYSPRSPTGSSSFPERSTQRSLAPDSPVG